MVVRHHQIDFASGALVFPGGKADPQDFDSALIPFLHGEHADTDMRAAQVGAIREAFKNAASYWLGNTARQTLSVASVLLHCKNSASQ